MKANVSFWSRLNIVIIIILVLAVAALVCRDFLGSIGAFVSSTWGNPNFQNGFGSAVGALAAILAFFLVRYRIEKRRSNPQVIRRYSCAHAQNVGNADEFEGELMHHHGKRVSQSAELEAIGRTGPVWEWNRTPCGKDAGASVIYGPYTTDFSEPGEYEIVFAIRGVGFPKAQEIQDDRILLRLNVTRKTAKAVPTANGIALFETITTVARRLVRAGELASGSWENIRVRFYAGGDGLEGLWEYVILAFDGASEKPDNLAALGNNVRLFFDFVEVTQIRKMKVPWD